jgi:hypothetical protein
MASETGAFSADIRYQKSVVVPHMYADRFGGAESDTQHHWMHTGSYYHSISTMNIYCKSVVGPHMYAETPQCQIRRCRI